MRLAICDDKLNQIDLIKTATNNFFCKRNEAALEIDTFENAFEFLQAQEKNEYDLVLLDICMPGMLGTDAAKEIRQRRDKTEIVFLTTSNEFAIDAFQVRAAHYLLKPFTQLSFDEAMERVLHNIFQTTVKTVAIKCPGGALEVIEKDSIAYIESASHRQKVYFLDGKTIEAVNTLAELYKILFEQSPEQFINPYKGFIVNLCAIRTIESNRIILKCGKEIPIPRRSFRQIKQSYFDYMFGSIA